MGYSTGMMNRRIKIAKRVDSTGGDFGRSSGGQKYTMLGEFWASETFNKGVKALREGAVDAYDTVMFRMRWNNIVTRDCRLECNGVTYQIQSLHADRRQDTLQITAVEIVK